MNTVNTDDLQHKIETHANELLHILSTLKQDVSNDELSMATGYAVMLVHKAEDIKSDILHLKHPALEYSKYEVTH